MYLMLLTRQAESALVSNRGGYSTRTHAQRALTVCGFDEVPNRPKLVPHVSFCAGRALPSWPSKL